MTTFGATGSYSTRALRPNRTLVEYEPVPPISVHQCHTPIRFLHIVIISFRMLL